MMHITLSKLAKQRSAESYWRCGVRHTREGATFPADRFTAEELRRLEADPMLDVTGVDAPVPTQADREAELRAKIANGIADLAPAEFTDAGYPQVGAIKARFKHAADEIDAKLVRSVFAQMASDGFEVPTEQQANTPKEPEKPAGAPKGPDKPADPPKATEQPAPPPPAQQRDDAQGQG